MLRFVYLNVVFFLGSTALMAFGKSEFDAAIEQQAQELDIKIGRLESKFKFMLQNASGYGERVSYL